MLELAILGDSLGNINLRLETVDAGVGCIWVSHHSADATPDLLGDEELLISDLDTSVFVDASHSDVILVFRVVKVESLVVSVYFWLEQHVLFLFLLVNLHVCN